MVRGLEVFAEAFSNHADEYVLIGGAAAWLWFEEAGLTFRATKDLDLVLTLDVLGSAMAASVWAFVEAGGYGLSERGDGSMVRYRFAKPSDRSYPAQVELFATSELELVPGQNIIPLVADEGASDLSAILMDPTYRDVVELGGRTLRGVTCLAPAEIVLLKARAFLNLKEREATGERVDSRDLRKHRNDVFRLANLLGAEPTPASPAQVFDDLRTFLAAIEADGTAASAIRAACGELPLDDPAELAEVIREHFDLS